MKIRGLLAAITFLTITCGCKHVVEYDCTGITPTYTQNIKPVLDATCALSGCHTGNDPEGNINLADYTGASAASKKKSFMASIQHMPFYAKMPKGGDRLPDAQIHLLYCWIQNGSPE